MMNQQQNGCALKERLVPEQFDDGHEAWTRCLDIISITGVIGESSVAIGDTHCLVYESKHNLWRYYRLPKPGWSWFLERNSTRLWGLVDYGKLVVLDFHSGEWMQFQHRISYSSILYAEEDVVIARCKAILAFDGLRLCDDNLRRIISVPIFRPENDITRLKTVISVFWPEENQFIVLEDGYHEQTLWRLNFYMQSETILKAEKHITKVRLPFVVMLDARHDKLIYADLRESPVELKQVTLPLRFKWRKYGRWWLKDAFIFDGNLIVVLELTADDEERAVIVQLGAQPEAEVLYECASHKQGVFSKSLLSIELHQLGQFILMNSKLAYDLAARQEVHNVPWWTLLRKAVHNEVKPRQQQSKDIKKLPIPTYGNEYSILDTFKVSLHASSFHISEDLDQRFLFKKAISSSEGSSSSAAIFSQSDMPAVYVLAGGNSRFQCLLPEIESRWGIATFDEKGRLWVCTTSGEHVAVVHPTDEKERRGFVLPRLSPSTVYAFAAYDDNLVVGYRDKLIIYRYDGESLKEAFQCKNVGDVVGIKPDTKEIGWWIVRQMYDYGKHSWKLEYLSPDKGIVVPKEVAQIDSQVMILGDWPKGACFVRSDLASRELYYTLDPYGLWHKVSLQLILREAPLYISPICLTNNDDVFFTMLRVNDDCLLIRLHADNPELISVFNSNAGFARWGNWLVLYSINRQPLVFARAYADCAAITELPENKGILFFHLPTNQFCAKPYQPYAITDALRSMLGSGARGFLKSSL